MFNKKILINLNCLRVAEIQNTFEGIKILYQVKLLKNVSP